MTRRVLEYVTVTRQGAATGDDDEQGNPILTPSSSFQLGTTGVAPLTPEESTAAFGAENKGGYTLYLLPSADLQSTDLVTVRGESGFQVWGEEVEWRSPFTGDRPGNVVIVRRST